MNSEPTQIVIPHIFGFCEGGAFEESYQRNNKKGGKKNLRCFPHCGPTHKNSNACEVPVQLYHTPRGESVDQTDFFVFGRFLTEEEDYRDEIQNGTIRQLKEIQSQTRNSQNQLKPFYQAEKLIPRHNMYYYEFREKGWHYGWKSNKYLKDVKHVFKVYLFLKLDKSDAFIYENCGNQDPCRIQCVASVSSTPFGIYSSRSKNTTKKNEVASSESGIDSVPKTPTTPSTTSTTTNFPEQYEVSLYDSFLSNVFENTDPLPDQSLELRCMPIQEVSQFDDSMNTSLMFPKRDDECSDRDISLEGLGDHNLIGDNVFREPGIFSDPETLDNKGSDTYSTEFRSEYSSSNISTKGYPSSSNLSTKGYSSSHLSDDNSAAFYCTDNMDENSLTGLEKRDISHELSPNFEEPPTKRTRNMYEVDHHHEVDYHYEVDHPVFVGIIGDTTTTEKKKPAHPSQVPEEVHVQQPPVARVVHDVARNETEKLDEYIPPEEEKLEEALAKKQHSTDETDDIPVQVRMGATNTTTPPTSSPSSPNAPETTITIVPDDVVESAIPLSNAPSPCDSNFLWFLLLSLILVGFVTFAVGLVALVSTPELEKPFIVTVGDCFYTKPECRELGYIGPNSPPPRQSVTEYFNRMETFSTMDKLEKETLRIELQCVKPSCTSVVQVFIDNYSKYDDSVVTRWSAYFAIVVGSCVFCTAIISLGVRSTLTKKKNFKYT